MKHLFTTTIAILLSNLFVNAQCDYRYQQEIFSNFTLTSDIIFGSSVDINGNTIDLKMDIYEPTGDTLSVRPILIMAHGGSFLGGTKTDPDVVAICESFAKRGYVTCSYEYRVGIQGFIPNAATATDAVYRAVQDGKAAVRFFRQDAATTNTYKIDPNQIFLGGSSAGAFIALHLAYLNQPSELPSTIDTTVLGGMEGTSGNPGYPSNVKAIVNLCGALGDKNWIVPGDIPVCSMHGTIDGTVPYDHAMLYMLNIFSIMVVDGSSVIHPYALSQGVDSWYYQWEGADHVPYLGDQAYMDTTLAYVSDFLYHHLDSYSPVIDSVSYSQSVSCTGANSGYIDLNVAGSGSTFIWSNGDTTEDLSNLPVGFYNVTITDASGCTYSPGTPIHINQSQGPSATATVNNVTTMGGTNGAINITITNGQSPYTFIWSNGSTTKDISNLTAGNYSVTVFDANGCSTTQSSSVSEPSGLSEITSGNFYVYPSPATDYLIINFSNSSMKQNTIQLFDIYGKLVLEYIDFTGAKLKIDRDDLSFGSYFIRISNVDYSSTVKIVFE